MKRFLGLLLSVVMLTGILSGCAETPVENSGTSTPESSPATTGTSASDESKAASAWPRTITDDAGNEIVLEKKPERIVSTDWIITEPLMALEVPPLASGSVDAMSEWETTKAFFEKHRVENLGWPLNFEEIISLNPDLILINSSTENDIVEQLEKIAPCIVLDISLTTMWNDRLTKVANIVGAEDTAMEFIENTQHELDTARTNFSNMDKKVVFITAMTTKSIYAHSVDQLNMFYDSDQGLGLVAPEGWPDETAVISLEILAEIDPDYIFVAIQDQEYMDEISSTSVWKALSAVKESRVYPFDYSGITGGPLATKYSVKVLSDSLLP